MSRSLLHDWEYDIDRCCRDDLPCEMTKIAEDIYNTAYARGKNHSDATEVLDKLRAEIKQYQSDYDVHGTEYDRTAWKAFNRCLQIIDKYKAEVEPQESEK